MLPPDLPPLTEYGAYVTTHLSEGFIAARAAVESFHNEHPEVGALPIDHPVFIVGTYRTGTTHLHRLLACDPRFRVLLGWESDIPVPPVAGRDRLLDPRCLEYAEFQEAIFRDDPRLATMHWEPAHLAAEDVRLMAQTGWSGLWPAIVPCPDYIESLMTVSLDEQVAAYRHHKRCLQVQHSAEPGRWLCKAPGHSLMLPGLLEVYPDATFIVVDRDLDDVVSSAVDMWGHLQVKTTGVSGVEPRLYRRYLEEHMRRTDDVEIRVDYDWLLDDPVGVARHLSLVLWGDYPSPVAQAQLNYLADHPQDKFGRHTYARVRS